jgi:hypothetical protein
MDNENEVKQQASQRRKLIKFYIVFPLIGLFWAGCNMFLKSGIEDDMGLVKYLAVLIPALIFGAWIDFIVFIVRKSGKSDITILVYVWLTIFVVGIAAAIFIPNFYRPRNSSMYTSCLESLTTIKVVEEMYYADQNRYSKNGLGYYLILNAKEGDPQSDKELERRISNSCDGNEIGKPWTLDMIEISPDGKQYKIRGRSKELYHCAIEVTAKGYSPRKYKGCIEQGMKDPRISGMFRKQKIISIFIMTFSVLCLFLYLFFELRSRKMTIVVPPKVD